MEFPAIKDILRFPFLHPFLPSERIYAMHLLSAVIIAALVYVRAEKRWSFSGFVAYAFSRKLFFHRSAKVDYVYFIFNRMLLFGLIVPVWLSADRISKSVTAQLDQQFGARTAADSASPLEIVLVTIASILIFDFLIFLAHYLQHRFPLLWEFHKVHHSAEVLTPITVYRMHPVDDLLTIGLVAIGAGAFKGLIAHLHPGGVQPMMVGGINVFLFFYYAFGYNLRHSNVWLDYGPRLSKFLISPAQHQIHHSQAQHHYDKNMGFIFSLWDRLFGTIYIPSEHEQIEFGLGAGEEKEYSSALTLYLLPFKKAAKLIRRRFVVTTDSQ